MKNAVKKKNSSKPKIFNKIKASKYKHANALNSGSYLINYLIFSMSIWVFRYFIKQSVNYHPTDIRVFTHKAKKLMKMSLYYVNTKS